MLLEHIFNSPKNNIVYKKLLENAKFNIIKCDTFWMVVENKIHEILKEFQLFITSMYTDVYKYLYPYYFN